MLFNKPLNGVELGGSEAEICGQCNGGQPELCLGIIPRHMNMRRLVSFPTVK